MNQKKVRPNLIKGLESSKEKVIKTKIENKNYMYFNEEWNESN